MLNFLRTSRFLILIGVFLIIVFVALIAFFTRPVGQKSATPTPLPVPSDYTRNYTNLNLVKPGQTTYKELISLVGYPLRSAMSAGKTYLYYPTPLGVYENRVVLQNNVVLYALENVFGSYRGTFADVVIKYGKEDFRVYKEGEPYAWYVYLEKGLVVEVDGTNNILIAVYFIPGNKDYFLKTVASDLKLTTTPQALGE